VQGLMLRFQAATNAMTPGSREHRLAEKALERADDLVIQARDRVRDLRAKDRPVEFHALLQELAEHYRRDGLSISLISDEQVGPLAPEAAEHLLRIVAEALANTLRHAKASEVVIRVGGDDKRLQLSITDNGIGFPVEVITNKGRPGHFGVQGMCERAYALGGTLRMKNSADGGARIELLVPLAD
jgi:signal transduction histidine kinase